MRILSEIAFAAIALVIVAQPVLAACPAGSLILSNDGTNRSGIWNPGVFAPSYAATYLPYVAGNVPPWTANFDATFWAMRLLRTVA